MLSQGRHSWTPPPVSEPRRAIIRVGRRCNNRCDFCHCRDAEDEQEPARRVVWKIHRARQLGCDLVAFSGGEPTLRRELPSWIRAARQLGLAAGLISNGRMLAYDGFRDALLEAGLGYVHLSLHSGIAGVHDRMVKAPAFEQTAAAARALAQGGVDMTIGCVVTRTNLDTLRSLVDLCGSLTARRLKLAHVEPKGGALAAPAAVVPRASDAARAIVDAIAYANQRGEVDVAHENLPLCLVPGWEHRSEGLRQHGFVLLSDVGEHDFGPVLAEDRVHPASCDGCGLRGRCPGLHAEYVARHGAGELVPRSTTRANSFNYVPVQRLPWPGEAGCPLPRHGVAPFANARHLLLRRPGALVILATGTRDFTDLELSRAVNSGQLYLDLTSKDAPTDFVRDVAQLRMSRAASVCALARECGGCREISDTNVLARDDAELRSVLATLSGDVLDIGCGSGRYLDAVFSSAQAGRIRYTGVDPDVAAVERLRAAHPWATVHRAPIEGLALPPRSFDHVLLVGSYNHLKEPEPALAHVLAALRPGGTVLACDDVPFGLVRSASHARRAQESSAVHEHYRCDGLEAAEACLLRVWPPALGVAKAVRRRSVGPDTSNQWLLQLRSMPAEESR